MRRPKDKLFAGIDLHGNNLVIGVIDQDGRRVTHRKLDCQLDQVEEFLQPHKSQLQGAAVESTFNWYWLVDGLRARGYAIELANPAQIEQYSGIKHADDKHDAFFLAELQRLNILPNYGTHKHPRVQRWLKRHERFIPHFVPTSSSWLNLVERWFGELTGKRIRRGVFVSVEDLQKAIEEFLAAWNSDPKPFVWTATVESILEKLSRCKQTLERIKPGCTRARMRKNKGK
jgi:hypothetical protein